MIRSYTLSSAVLFVATLAACGTDSQVQTSEECKSTDLSDTEKELVFSNWPEYIDVETRKVNGQKQTVIPTLLDFEERTGIVKPFAAGGAWRAWVRLSTERDAAATAARIIAAPISSGALFLIIRLRWGFILSVLATRASSS